MTVGSASFFLGDFFLAINGQGMFSSFLQETRGTTVITVDLNLKEAQRAVKRNEGNEQAN
jgi:hypothetical protein